MQSTCLYWTPQQRRPSWLVAFAFHAVFVMTSFAFPSSTTLSTRSRRPLVPRPILDAPLFQLLKPLLANLSFCSQSIPKSSTGSFSSRLPIPIASSCSRSNPNLSCSFSSFSSSLLLSAEGDRSTRNSFSRSDFPRLSLYLILEEAALQRIGVRSSRLQAPIVVKNFPSLSTVVCFPFPSFCRVPIRCGRSMVLQFFRFVSPSCR